MKRTLALILCLLLLVLSLASCQTEIGEYMKEYDYEDEIVQRVVVNLYLPCTTETTENAKVSVSNRVVALGETDFTAEIRLIYVPANDPEAYKAAVVPQILAHKEAADSESSKYDTVSSKVAQLTYDLEKLRTDGKSDEEINAKKAEIALEKKKISYLKTSGLSDDQVKYSVDLVLVNSEEMFNELYNGKVLSDVTGFLAGTTYGKLNTQITMSLLTASKKDNKFYSIPNNHVIGCGYEFLVIDKAIARDQLHYSPEELQSLKSIEDAKDLLCRDYFSDDGEGNITPIEAKITALPGITELPATEEEIRSAILNALNFEDIFKVETKRNRYEDRALIEAEGKYCNVIRYPQVTPAEVYQSAFVIANAVSGVSSDRAMKIIYDLNTDQELHNLLLYGMKSSHYNVVDPEARRFASTQTGTTTMTISTEGITDVYQLAPDENIAAMYCGDQFLSYYIGDWNETAAENGEAHNAESVILVQ